ncbi:MAG: SRPBCC family protein [Bacteroidia bacterium]|nr:SRPBCC family protein [Bacteroidia bacterium]
MKILKRILIVLLIVIAAAAVIGFFLPSHKHVERSVEMNATTDQVYEVINDLKNWSYWSPWYKLDPQAKIIYSDPSSGAGAYYTWESRNSDVGKGKLTITESTQGSYVKTKIEMGSMPPSYGEFKIESNGATVKVTWGFDGDFGSNPFYRIMGSLMDYMIGKMFDQGLADMKQKVESMPVPAPANVPDSTASKPA